MLVIAVAMPRCTQRNTRGDPDPRRGGLCPSDGDPPELSNSLLKTSIWPWEVPIVHRKTKCFLEALTKSIGTFLLLI